MMRKINGLFPLQEWARFNPGSAIFAWKILKVSLIRPEVQHILDQIGVPSALTSSDSGHLLVSFFFPFMTTHQPPYDSPFSTSSSRPCRNWASFVKDPGVKLQFPCGGTGPWRGPCDLSRAPSREAASDSAKHRSWPWFGDGCRAWCAGFWVREATWSLGEVSWCTTFIFPIGHV